ncbi:programmed cell death protein 10-like [Dysidea avara]|uniref:programmed cell death protein 10-like n=1 Tax=Dysidea avara TaxID=196820 RepID=UPI003329B5FB
MMDEQAAVASLSLHVVLNPIFKELEADEHSIAAVQTLRTAFNKAEKDNPGVCQQFIGGLLEAEGININIPETLLRLACTDCDVYVLRRPEPEFVQLNERAQLLKVILSRIPDQIGDRSRFLQTIKDIASAIRDLLDSVNEVSKKHQANPKLKEYKKALDNHKRVFVRNSKSFSDTLKRYFKDGQSENVFLSANRLINQTNTLLSTFKQAS